MATWTPKVDFVDTITAADINNLQTIKVDGDGTATPSFAGATIAGHDPIAFAIAMALALG